METGRAARSGLAADAAGEGERAGPSRADWEASSEMRGSPGGRLGPHPRRQPADLNPEAGG